MPYPTPPAPTGGQSLVTWLAITVCPCLFLLLAWFLIRTLKQIEDAIQSSKAETTLLRTELGVVKQELKDYAGLVQHLKEETGVLKQAYAALERAFAAMDKWLYGQAMLGKLPHPPNFKAPPETALVD